MNDIGIMFMVFAAGCLLGGIFYGGLWWTVQKGLVSRYPAVWFFASLWIRLGVTLAGFYAVADNDWRRILTCLAGFLFGRLAVTWLTKENRHAH